MLVVDHHRHVGGILQAPRSQTNLCHPRDRNDARMPWAVSLTSEQFRFGFGNELAEEESNEVFEQWAIPSPARPLFQAAVANVAVHSEAKVNTGRPWPRPSYTRTIHFRKTDHSPQRLVWWIWENV
jgi:hypothetical protein